MSFLTKYVTIAQILIILWFIMLDHDVRPFGSLALLEIVNIGCLSGVQDYIISILPTVHAYLIHELNLLHDFIGDVLVIILNFFGPTVSLLLYYFWHRVVIIKTYGDVLVFNALESIEEALRAADALPIHRFTSLILLGPTSVWSPLWGCSAATSIRRNLWRDLLGPFADGLGLLLIWALSLMRVTVPRCRISRGSSCWPRLSAALKMRTEGAG